VPCLVVSHRFATRNATLLYAFFWWEYLRFYSLLWLFCNHLAQRLIFQVNRIKMVIALNLVKSRTVLWPPDYSLFFTIAIAILGFCILPWQLRYFLQAPHTTRFEPRKQLIPSAFRCFRIVSWTQLPEDMLKVYGVSVLLELTNKRTCWRYSVELHLLFYY
jgi:hypothetical protein